MTFSLYQTPMCSIPHATHTDRTDTPGPEISWKEALVQTMADLAFVFTPEGQMLDWNDRVSEVTGCSDDEIRQMHPVEFVPQRHRELVKEMIDTVLADGRVVFEAEFKTAGGGVPYEFRAFLLEQDDQRIIYGTGRDITRRRHTTQTARDATRRYRRLFEESPEGIIVTMAEGTIVDVNPAFCQLVGYSREELLGRHVSRLYAHPEQRDRLVQQLYDQDVQHDFRAEAQCKDGSTVPCQLSATTWKSPDGDIEAFQTFVRDVTEETEARRALQESEGKFRTLAEQSPVGIGVIQDGCLRYVNRAHARMLGYTRDELTGRSPETFVHPDDRPTLRSKIERRIRGEVEAVNYTFRAITKEGNIRLIEVYGGRIIYEGQPAVVGTLVDITERRRLQREILSIQEEERERIGKDLHDAVGSHLSGTTMALRALANRAAEECPELGEELERITSLVQESSRDAQRLARGLSAVGLQDEGLPFALERLVMTTAEAMECEITNCDELELPSEVASHLYWIAQEAVTNARKYADAGLITVELTREDQKLTLTVTDDGRGFESSRAKEAGLGLRTMQYRAELLGGSLSIDSEPGQGTRVQARAPID